MDTSPLSIDNINESSEISSKVLKEVRYKLKDIIRNSREVIEALEI